MVMRQSLHLAVQRCNWKWRLLKGKALDDFLELRRDGAACASILARLSGQRRKTPPAILRDPSMRSSIRYARCSRDGLQRLFFLKVRLEQSEPI
jgi:hypothetical protein